MKKKRKNILDGQHVMQRDVPLRPGPPEFYSELIIRQSPASISVSIISNGPTRR